MKITVLSSSFPAHSDDYAGIFIERVLQPLAARGHSISVVTPSVPGGPASEQRGALEIHRFRYAPGPVERLAGGPGGIPAALARSPLLATIVPPFMTSFAAAAWRHSEDTDLLHANWALPAGLVALLVSRLRKIPYVVTLRGSDLQRLGSNPLLRPILRKVLTRAAAVTAVGTHLADRARCLGVPDDLIEVIPSGTAPRPEVGDFRPAPELPRPRALFVGSLIPQKGLNALLESIVLLEGRGHPVHAWIVGDGPEHTRLQERATELGIAGRLAFTGARSPEEIPHWMMAADFLVLPSLSEGRPNAIYEALACGVPVVASELPGTAEVIRDGENGLLVPPGDPEALARAMERLITDEPLRSRLSTNASQWFSERAISWEECAQCYERVFLNALEGRSAKRKRLP